MKYINSGLKLIQNGDLIFCLSSEEKSIKSLAPTTIEILYTFIFKNQISNPN